jgi:hypothetical protein
MSYYPSLAEDIARAKEILANGRAGDQPSWMSDEEWARLSGGTIYGADLYAAYKLLETFVQKLDLPADHYNALATRLERHARILQEMSGPHPNSDVIDVLEAAQFLRDMAK